MRRLIALCGFILLGWAGAQAAELLRFLDSAEARSAVTDSVLKPMRAK